MTELSPEALALLEAARRSHGPTEHERERVRGGLYASLGIAVPLALTASAAEAASAANLAASVQGTAAVQSAGQAVQAGAQAMLTQAGAAGAAKGGVWGFGVKLLTWNAGKVFLATLALGSAVGVGVHTLPRVLEDNATGARAGRSIAKGRARVAPPPAAVVPSIAEPAEPSTADDRAPPGEPVVKSVPVVSSVTEVAPPATRAAEAAPVEALSPRPTVEPAGAPVVTGQLGATPVESKPTSTFAASAMPSARSHHVASERRTSSARAHRRHVRSSLARGTERLETSASESPSAANVGAPEKPSATATLAAPNPAVVAPAASAGTPVAAASVASDSAAKPLVPGVASAQATGELALIRKALTSLRDHDAVGALALLDEHAARYPSGAFATERRGLHVVALCAAGNLRDGRDEQATFLRQAASSPIAPRVRRACEEPKK